jgi:hypothetical protein
MSTADLILVDVSGLSIEDIMKAEGPLAKALEKVIKDVDCDGVLSAFNSNI